MTSTTTSVPTTTATTVPTTTVAPDTSEAGVLLGIGDAASGGDVAGTADDGEAAAALSTGGLRLIGRQQLDAGASLDGVPIGGLSGIDYSDASGRWIAVSDDRSAQGPARYYDLALPISQNDVGPVDVFVQHPFAQADGTPYPDEAAGGVVPDAESIRLDPTDGSLWWVTEGSRTLGLDSSLVHADIAGTELATSALPAAFAPGPDPAMGIDDNHGMEGLTFSADGETLFAIVEGPLLQDGDPPTADAGATSRIVQFDRTGVVVAQYAYPLDALQHASGLAASSAENGATEILAVSETQLIVVERAATPTADGTIDFHIRLYVIDLDGASDIDELDTLSGVPFQPVTKSLLVDLDSLDVDLDLGGAAIDNIEGITFGPSLDNGNPTLVVVSDDNFSDTQTTQFLVFEIVPA